MKSFDIITEADARTLEPGSSVTLKPGAAYFMAEPKRADIGFPRYRVLFYNETGASVNASFFAYRGR